MTAFTARGQVSLLILLCVVAAVRTPAQTSKVGDLGSVQSKKRIAVPGETDRYKIEMKITSPQLPGKVIVISERFERFTKDAKPDGTLTLVDTFNSGTVSFGGAPQDILKMLPIVTITRDKAGKFATKADGGSAEGNPEVMGVLQQFAATADSLLPAKPAKAGDKWKVSFLNANSLVGGPKLFGEAEFTTDEQINAANTNRITFKLYENEGDKQIQGEGVVTVDALGKISRLVQKGRGAFAGGPATVELDIARIDSQK